MTQKIVIVEDPVRGVRIQVDGKDLQFDGAAGCALALAEALVELAEVRRHIHQCATFFIALTPDQFSRIGIGDMRDRMTEFRKVCGAE